MDEVGAGWDNDAMDDLTLEALEAMPVLRSANGRHLRVDNDEVRVWTQPAPNGCMRVVVERIHDGVWRRSTEYVVTRVD